MSSPVIMRLGTRASRLALWQAEHVKGLLEAMPGGPRHRDRHHLDRRGSDSGRSAVAAQGPGVLHQGDRIRPARRTHRLGRAQHEGSGDQDARRVGARCRSRTGGPPRRHSERDGRRTRRPSGRRQGGHELVTAKSIPRLSPARPRDQPICAATCRLAWPSCMRAVRSHSARSGWSQTARVSRPRSAHTSSRRIFLRRPDRAPLPSRLESDDAATRSWLEDLDHAPTHAATAAERALLRRIEGGCQVPAGALASVSGREIQLRAWSLLSTVACPCGLARRPGGQGRRDRRRTCRKIAHRGRGPNPCPPFERRVLEEFYVLSNPSSPSSAPQRKLAPHGARKPPPRRRLRLSAVRRSRIRYSQPVSRACRRVFQLSVDEVVDEAAEVHRLGIPAVILFGVPAAQGRRRAARVTIRTASCRARSAPSKRRCRICWSGRTSACVSTPTTVTAVC